MFLAGQENLYLFDADPLAGELGPEDADATFPITPYAFGGAGSGIGVSYSDALTAAGSRDLVLHGAALFKVYVLPADAPSGDLVDRAALAISDADGYRPVVAGLADHTGDGIAELLVASPEYAGTVYLFEGPFDETRALSEADAAIASASGGYFGASMSAGGDLTGDGLDDFVVSAHGEGAGDGGPQGRVRVFDELPSGAMSPSDAALTISGDDAEELGAIAKILRDLDGDGYDDLAFAGAGPNYALYVELGPPDAGAATDSDLRFEAPGEDNYTDPTSLDFDGDGQQDFAVTWGWSTLEPAVFHGPLSDGVHQLDADATAWLAPDPEFGWYRLGAITDPCEGDDLLVMLNERYRGIYFFDGSE